MLRRALVAAIVLQSVSAGAQTLRGVVMLPDSTRAAGAIVVATAAGGGEPSRTLTNMKGEYVLRLGSAGRYDVRVLRVGFHPTVVPAFEIAPGETRTLPIVLRGDPVILAKVNVNESSACRVRPDSGLAVAQAWNEARSAILTTQLSASEPLFAEWIDYSRTFDASAQIVRKQTVRTSRNPTTHAFKSLPADTLAMRGYAIDNSAGTIFYAPDEGVLLSDSFAASHCFRLVPPPPERAGFVGVGFEPTRVRTDVRDIAGTFWIDRTTAELRSLEFHYTNLPEPVQGGAGGTVEFRRLDDGGWLVDRWTVRVPQIGAAGQQPREAGISLGYSASSAVVRAVQVTGGQVVRVTRRDTLVYRATGDTLAVQLVERDTLVRAAGGVLSLEGTDYTAKADAHGLVTLAPVLEGQYVARVGSAMMDSLGIEEVEHTIDVRARTHVDSIMMPTSSDVLRKVCPADSLRHGEGMVRGTVRDERGHVLRQGAVTVTWQGDFAKVSGALLYSERTMGVLTDDDGRYRLCGVARDLPLTVSVVSDSGADSRTVTLALNRPFGTVDLVARKSAVAGGTRGASERALVELAVYGSGGAPLPDATLDITNAAGATRTIVTGSGGRALLPDVTPGLLRVRIKRIGFKPGQLAVTVAAGRNTVPIHLSDAAMPSLDTVRVMGGTRGYANRDGFETRKLQGFGTFVTAEEIAKHTTPLLVDVLARIKGVRVEYGVRIGPGTTGRVMPYLTGTSGTRCVPNVFVDGAIFMRISTEAQQGVRGAGMDSLANPLADMTNQFADLSLAVRPENIFGIEVYTNSGNTPPQFDLTSSTGCGSIVIWTK